MWSAGVRHGRRVEPIGGGGRHRGCQVCRLTRSVFGLRIGLFSCMGGEKAGEKRRGILLQGGRKGGAACVAAAGDLQGR